MNDKTEINTLVEKCLELLDRIEKRFGIVSQDLESKKPGPQKTADVKDIQTK